MWGKPYITRLEKEFKTNELRDKHVFHDANLRVQDPDEFRLTSVEYLRGLGYIVDVNEMTEFDEDAEFSKFFRGGRLKPLKNVIKARKSTNLGSRFSVTWKLLFMVGFVSLIGFMLPYEQLNKDLLFYMFTLSFIIAGLLYLVKQLVISTIWVKMIGVYDVENTKADVRVIISGDTSEPSIKVFDSLRDEVAEFYELINRRYLKKTVKDSIVKPTAKSKSEELMNKIVKVNSNIRALQDKFINGRVSEDIFKRLMNDLERDKEKYETVMDLVSL